MQHCQNLEITGSSDQTVLLHFYEFELANVIPFLPPSILQYLSLKNQSTDSNIVCNLA
jgi:hypothetical protein